MTTKHESSSMYKGLSSQLHAHLDFAEVRDRATDVVDSLGVHDFPTVIVIKVRVGGGRAGVIKVRVGGAGLSWGHQGEGGGGQSWGHQGEGGGVWAGVIKARVGGAGDWGHQGESGGALGWGFRVSVH